jgi:DNA-directed RNA polymerase specialized sigma24 family protein
VYVTATPTVAALLSEASWLRRFAARLAADDDETDELVQEAWITAWQRQPDASRPLRPWPRSPRELPITFDRDRIGP